MNKHINFQTINQNGHPAFVVIPYAEFLQLYPLARESEMIPHTIVQKMIREDISRIKAWREYLGFTQQEVATQLGVSQAALSQIEAISSRPRKSTLEKLALIFGIKIEQLR